MSPDLQLPWGGTAPAPALNPGAPPPVTIPPVHPPVPPLIAPGDGLGDTRTLPHRVELSPPPSEGHIPVDTVGQLLANALVDGGIVGIDESIEPSVMSKALRYANWLLVQWARKRWLVYSLTDYHFISTGHERYLVGEGQTVDINPRPDKLEYAFLRFLARTKGPPQFPVDIPLDVISSKEDYARIPVKSIGTISWRIFYDPQWPLGVLYPWPIPQQGLYEIHLGFKTVLPRFSSLQQAVNFPPEYEAAINFVLARNLRAAFYLPPNPEINAIARDALNVLRNASQAMWTLRMPHYLRSRHGAYDLRGDTG